MPLPAFLTGLFGAKPKDIDLPSETSRDPRLPAPSAEQQKKDWNDQQAAALAGLRGVK